MNSIHRRTREKYKSMPTAMIAYWARVEKTLVVDAAFSNSETLNAAGAL